MAVDSEQKRRTPAADERSLSSQSTTRIALAALPVAVLVLNFMVWITAVSRSGFWADDFLNVTRYARSLGDLSNDRMNQGKYVANLFWAIGTEAFGNGSVVPFLLLNAVVFAGGVVIWLRAGINANWSALDALWIGGVFIATTAWLPTTLWSSNIVHSAGFLALAAGIVAHQRCMRARSLQSTVLWSVATGVAWTLAVVSNLLYIGLLAIAAYCVVHQVLKLRHFGVSAARASIGVGFWSLLVPLIYFATVAYPSTTANSAYATNGLQFIHQNLRFYRALLAPSALLVAVYFIVLLGALFSGAVAARRRDWFPIALLAGAFATALPALIQSQQRDIHYMAMPLLLSFSSLAAGVRPLLLGHTKIHFRLRGALLLGAVVALFLIFRQGADIRSYFVQTPYGHNLLAFRSTIARLGPENATICATMDLDAQQQALLVAEMSGQDGFAVPPINAAQTFLLAPGAPCPAQSSATRITISLNTRSEFVAAG
jgi:hypothetical protein